MKRALVVLALLLVALPAFGAAAVRQAKTCAANSSSEACAFTSAPLEGSMLVMCAGHRGNSITISGIVSDSQGQTWTLIDQLRSNGNARNYMYYFRNTVAGANTVTVNYSSAAAHAISIAEITGVSVSAPLDTDAHAFTNNDNANPYRTGTITGTLDQSDNIFLTCMTVADGGSANDWSGAVSLSTTAVTEQTEGVNANIVVTVLHSEIRNGSTADEWIEATSVINSIPSVLRIQAFKPVSAIRTLTTTKAGTGTGRIRTASAGTNCGTGVSDCTELFDDGATGTLLALPGADSTFAGWSGDADCSDGSVTMSANVACTATFTLKVTRTLTVTKAGACDGLVRSAGREIDCDTGCTSDTYTFRDGDIDWINVYPDAGCKFDGWSGTGAPASTVGGKVTMNAGLTLTATFSAQGGSAEVFHVRSDGSNATNCTGLADAAYDGSGTGEACAFNTFAEGVNASRGTNPFSCTNGDDVKVHGAVTYSEAVVAPTVCQCPSRDNPCVIQLDGSTTVVDPGAGTAALKFGHSTGANRARFLQIRRGRYKGGTVANVGAIPGATVATETALVDLLLTDFAQFGPKVGPPDSAIQFTESFSASDNNIIDGVVFTGDVTSCTDFQATNGAHVCGTRFANAMYLGGTLGVDVRNVDGRYMRGQVARIAKSGIIQDSWFEGFGCTSESADDACFQVYDSSAVTFRRLVLKDVRGNDDGSFPIIKMRRTCIGGFPPGDPNNAPCANPVNVVGMALYNISAISTDCVGTTSACAANSHGSAIRADGFVSFVDGPSGDPNNFLGVYGEFTSNRSILRGIAGTGTLPLYTDDNTDINSVCPSPLAWGGDIFYLTNSPAARPKTCSGTFVGYDSSNIQIDPGINVGTALPAAASEACFPFGTAYTAADGDIANGWVGAYAGDCIPAAAPETCSDAIQNQDETCQDGGGVCGATCANGLGCVDGGDCLSGICTGSTCTAPAPPTVIIGRNPIATRGWPWWRPRGVRRFP